MSRWTDVLAQGRDYTVAAVGYLLPLGPDRLEPMDLPHTTMPPVPPAGFALRRTLRAAGTVRGAAQLNAGGRGIVARMIANQLESTSYRELRSDHIAGRRAAAGRTPAKSTRTRQWLYGGTEAQPVAPPRTMAEALRGCADCPK
jgi:hypothetical protein